MSILPWHLTGKRTAKDFTGLIIISWIISITIGMMNVVSRQEAHAVFAVLFLLVVFFLVGSSVVTTKKHLKMKRIQYVYHKTFMRKSLLTKKVFKRYWLLKFPAIIIFSYVACSIPWVINEIREGFKGNSSIPLFHSTSLLIYSLNFYFPSAICMYLRFMQWMSKKSKTEQRVRSCYRYRDMY